MRILKIITLGLLLCSFTAQAQDIPMQAAHEVQMGETLFSISKKYGVSVEAIQNANPKMGDTLLAGSVIFIPSSLEDQRLKQEAEAREKLEQTNATNAQGTVKESIPCKTMHQVQKKETVYSIARQFHLTEEELLRANPQITDNKLKKGEYLCIPYSATERYAQQQESLQYAAAQREREAAVQRAAEEAERKAKLFDQINVAVILPFNLDSDKKSKEAVKMIDFYEGFLLAVSDMKKKGVSVNVYAYDEPSTLSTGMDALLANPDLQRMNLIVGPMRLENLPSVSRFSKKHNIPLAVPFSTKASVTAMTPTCYQVNTSVSRFYKDIFKQFAEKHQGHNVLVVSTGDRGEKSDYALVLKQTLEEQGISFKSVNADDLTTLSKLTTNEQHTVVMPISNSQSAFEKVVNRLGQNNDIDSYPIELFGFPEWQTFSEKNKANMRKYHASFFCTFYADPSSTQVQEFNRNFKYWYRREQQATYPQYGLLGYDTAKFFITGLHQYGMNFMDSSVELRVPALQNPMQYRPQEGNGFINSYFRIVSF